MVKLFVENENLHSPVVAVRWCVDKTAINKLKELKVVKPFLLFVIAQEDNNGFRVLDNKVVPLDQAMEYIEFNRPGRHRIFGCLVWSYGTDPKRDLTRYFYSYQGYTYTGHSLVDLDGNFQTPHSHSDAELDNGSVDVVVPDGYFAKEPAAWEKWWVNLGYESKPLNQCHFRKRRILAYTLQPPIVLVYVLCRVGLSLAHVSVLLLLGIRNIQYEAIWHPFVYDRWDAAPDRLSSIFVDKSSGTERHPVYILTVPLVQLAILFLVVIIKGGLGLNWSGLSIVSVFLWLLVTNLMIVLGAFVAIRFGGKLKFFQEETKEQILAKQNLALERFYAEYQDVVCSGVSLQPNVSSLPLKRRTVYLRFKEFKSKVCLPFAR